MNRDKTLHFKQILNGESLWFHNTSIPSFSFDGDVTMIVWAMEHFILVNLKLS